MNPARFQLFAEAYIVAVLQAVVELGPHLGGKSPQQYALDACLSMLDTTQTHGVEAVAHYVLNTRGGAFRHTAEALGVEPTAKALQHYLEG